MVKKGGQRLRKIALSECTVKRDEQGQDRLYFRGRLYVPYVPRVEADPSKNIEGYEENELRVLLITLTYAQPVAGYYSINKYRELLYRDYF